MRYLIGILLAFASLAAFGGIDKVAVPTRSGLKLMWWPEVAPPEGWHFDRGSSYYFAFNAMAPDGSTFSKAGTVMYAKAAYKPRWPEIKTLDAYIHNDTVFFKQHDPGVVVVHEQTFRTKDGQSFEVVFYHPRPGGTGNWERVAYGEEDQYFLTFVISSRTQQGLKAAMPAFTSMLSSYRAGPGKGSKQTH